MSAYPINGFNKNFADELYQMHFPYMYVSHNACALILIYATRSVNFTFRHSINIFMHIIHIHTAKNVKLEVCLSAVEKLDVVIHSS